MDNYITRTVFLIGLVIILCSKACRKWLQDKFSGSIFCVMCIEMGCDMVEDVIAEEFNIPNIMLTIIDETIEDEDIIDLMMFEYVVDMIIKDT